MILPSLVLRTAATHSVLPRKGADDSTSRPGPCAGASLLPARAASCPVQCRVAVAAVNAAAGRRLERVHSRRAAVHSGRCGRTNAAEPWRSPIRSLPRYLCPCCTGLASTLDDYRQTHQELYDFLTNVAHHEMSEFPFLASCAVAYVPQSTTFGGGDAGCRPSVHSGYAVNMRSWLPPSHRMRGCGKASGPRWRGGRRERPALPVRGLEGTILQDAENDGAR
jgi:hypothetical protein